ESGWGAIEDEVEAVPPTVTTEVEEDTARREPSRAVSGQPLAGANRPEAREVIVINVLAKSGEDFKGVALKKLFEACGLEHGDMDIYHRHEESDTTSPVQFSVANAVEPGTFKPGDMPTLATPGISFFMSMPGPTNALQAFDFMLETAQAVVRNLGGELKDERRSVMTPQTIEHCRQRIREFERKQRSQRV
ncbi:MAG TPA: cell division protein ZipA, partial [Marinobacter adhaerens]|nr:cell division protein ZipA [Marinobacter adhaerens]